MRKIRKQLDFEILRGFNCVTVTLRRVFRTYNQILKNNLNISHVFVLRIPRNFRAK